VLTAYNEGARIDFCRVDDWATMQSIQYEYPPQITALPIHGSSAMLPVRRIYCVGRNYIDHIREMKEADERDPPFFFQKPTDSIVRSGATVPYPPDTRDFQFEVELVVAISRGGHNIDPTRARDHILGYAIGIELTRRDRQREMREKMLPWERGKSFDNSSPCGTLRRASDIGHPSSGVIALTVNGTTKQNGDISQMIWKVPEIITNLSTSYKLEPGDLIFTGTPAGVGTINVGDRLEGRMTGVALVAVTIGPPEMH
jgi:fumarylpyruvate hydrolase